MAASVYKMPITAAYTVSCKFIGDIYHLICATLDILICCDVFLAPALCLCTVRQNQNKSDMRIHSPKLQNRQGGDLIKPGRASGSEKTASGFNQ